LKSWRPGAVDPVHHRESIIELGMARKIARCSVHEPGWPGLGPQADGQHVELARLIKAALRVALGRSGLLYLDAAVAVCVLLRLAVLALDPDDSATKTRLYVRWSVRVDLAQARHGGIPRELLQEMMLSYPSADSDSKPFSRCDDLKQLATVQVERLFKRMPRRDRASGTSYGLRCS
jgi:hypothetical protein